MIVLFYIVIALKTSSISFNKTHARKADIVITHSDQIDQVLRQIVGACLQKNIHKNG